MASFLIVADDAEHGPAGFESTINALLLLGFCNQVGVRAELLRPRKHFFHRTPSLPHCSYAGKTRLSPWGG
jgi:hypothetical protein